MPVLDISKPASTGAVALACAIVAALTVMFGYSCSDDNPAAPDPSDPPLRITDLRDTLLTGNSLELLWTAPGNDSTVIESYEVRYSVAPYDSTVLWWDSLATPLTIDRLLAKPGETQRLWVEGLAKSTAYEFACRAVGAENTKYEAQPVSDILRITTPADVAPDRIGDFTHDGWFDRRAVLKWSIPSDPDSHAVTQYDLRYSTSRDSLLMLWDLVEGQVAMTYTGSTGEVISTRTDPVPHDTFYAGIRSAGSDGMWSTVSNVVTFAFVDTTTTTGEDTVNTNFSIFAPTRIHSTEVVIGYGGTVTDDNFVRTVLRASSTRFTEENWFSSPEIQKNLLKADRRISLFNVPTLYTAIPATEGESLFVTIRSKNDKGEWNALRVIGILPTPDTVPPLSPTGLKLTREIDSFTVEWRNQGDARAQYIGATPAYGRVDAQELRIAHDSLTNEEWLEAESLPGNAPGNPGALEQYSYEIHASVESLYVGLRFRDELGNWTRFHTASSIPPDTIPPGTISDLSVRSNSNKTVTAFYTSAGGDGDRGYTAARHVLYLEGEGHDPEDWENAPNYRSTRALAADVPDSIRVDREFQPSTTYSFAIRSIDASGNQSELSNVVVIETPFRTNLFLVPDDFPTIAEAINGTTCGDTIFVKCGTYREDTELHFGCRTLLGAGAACTVIEGAGESPVLRLEENAIVRGFTIQGGSPDAAAVTIPDGMDAVLRECRIIDNPGLGVLAGGRAEIIDCDVLRNRGGGIESRGTIRNLRAIDNTGFGVRVNGGQLDSSEVKRNLGVGIELNAGTARFVMSEDNESNGVNMSDGLLQDSEIVGNDGAGVSMTGFHARLNRCRIHANKSDGLLVSHDPASSQEVSVAGCAIFDNKGNGILSEQAIRLEESAVYQNDEGGILSRHESVVKNSTVFDNETFGIKGENTLFVETTTVFGNGMGGVICLAEAVVKNSTIADNANWGIRVDSSAGELRLETSVIAFNTTPVENPERLPLTIACCILFEQDVAEEQPIRDAVVTTDFPATEFPYTWRDPLFCDPASDNYSIPDPEPLANGHRPCAGIGGLDWCETAATYHPIVLRVPDRFETIEEAILFAAPGDTIGIASGTYTEYNLSVAKSMVLRGEAGNPTNTILDMQQLGRFLSVQGVRVELDGLTLRNGRVWSELQYGGSIHVWTGSDFLAQNCHFEDNRAYYRGGAVYGNQCRLTFEDCRFIRNRADLGGAISLHGRFNESDISVTRCVFALNRANRFGAAILSELAAASYRHCTFYRNEDQPGTHIKGGIASNCIFAYGEQNGLGKQEDGRSVMGSQPNSACNDYFGLPDGVEYDTNPTLYHFSEDPLFCDAENLDFSLRDDSPCLDREICHRVGAYGAGCSSPGEDTQ